MAMAEFGCEHATIPEDILATLASLDLETNPPPGDYSTKHWGVPNPRLAHLVKIDPLAGPGWNGKLASTDIDYLANNGAALDKAIEEDDVTKRGLALALEEFQGNEMQTKTAIEEILKEIK
jgi:transaldolase